MGTEPFPRIALVALERAQVLDVTGPFEVFARVARRGREGLAPAGTGYAPLLLGLRAGMLSTSSGLRIELSGSISQARGPFDTVLVLGGNGVKLSGNPPALLRWLERQARTARRIGSVCTGAFALAEAGLLDGRRATTHWAYCDAFAAAYPRVRVEPQPIFVRDGRIWTSAGVTAGIDLALAMVEEDFGYAVAVSLAQDLVLFLKRPGDQAQFSSQLAQQAATREPLRELQAWIAEHLRDDLSVERLARRAAMSPRHFARVFAHEAGVTPARFVERLRLEAARERLCGTDARLDAVAAQCGFGTSESLRRAFLRAHRVSPGAYRARFRATRTRRSS